jgi:hypothetical protein
MSLSKNKGERKSKAGGLTTEFYGGTKRWDFLNIS